MEDLPKNFRGGDEALHFALGELFGAFGKIKKIELYMTKGQMDVEDFKGEALVVFHPNKHTGTHEKGDAAYDACSQCDGKYCLLGQRHWRIRCEPAKWQKEGYNVKDKERVLPCVELSNLWDFDPSMPLAYYSQVQEEIRLHAAEHVESPFVKVEPSLGQATVWTKGAQDAMRLASVLHKSLFGGRRVVAALCRKPKPMVEDEYEKSLKTLKAIAAGKMARRDAEAASQSTAALARSYEKDIQAATGAQPFRLKQGTRVKLKDLVAKSENNGKTGDVVKFLADLQKYQVKLDFDKTVKVRAENLEILDEMTTAEAAVSCEHVSALREEAASEALKAHEAAAKMAEVLRKPKAIADVDPDAVFVPTVCVDPALLPKRKGEEEEEAQAAEARVEERRRMRSRSRERILQERLEAANARLAADTGPRPKWLVTSPSDMDISQTPPAGVDAPKRQPPETREELLKMSVAKLKALLTEYGKTARGCLEKKDFVDRLKPA